MRKLRYLLPLVVLMILVVPVHARGPLGCGDLPSAGYIPEGTYDFANGCVHTITGTLLVFEGDTVTINGNGGILVSEGEFITIVSEGTLNINDLTLTGNGNSIGAIANYGDLTVENSAFKDNNATLYAGLFNTDGTATIINSAFIDNSSGDIGAIANNAELTIVGSCFEGNAGTMATDIMQGNGATLEAQENWWGYAATPNKGYRQQIFEVAGTVDTSNHLTSRPASCNAPIMES